jgi:16S rRNA (guanine1516-N2)-methyltransferase
MKIPQDLVKGMTRQAPRPHDQPPLYNAAMPEPSTPHLSAAIAVAADNPPLAPRAHALADRLGLPFAENPDGYDLLLTVAADRLELRTPPRPGPKIGPVSCDFTTGPFARRHETTSPRKDLLVRAIGFKKPPLRVVDATAGLGRDAALLALAGCSVVAVERSPIIAALLGDGLARAAEVHPEFRDNPQLIAADARDFLATVTPTPDVIYLDPMFPHRPKSALVKKEMRTCRLVTGDDPDADALLLAALRTGCRRVVVKRALHAPPIPGPTPSQSLKGVTVRYDLYLR